MFIIDRTYHRFFDDCANFIICTVTIGLTSELYIQGTVTKYASNHKMVIDAKHVGRRLSFYPANIIDQFFKRASWPEKILFEEAEKPIPSDANLKLSVFEKPLYAFGQAMFVNYFEKYRPNFETAFGADPYNWPSEWNFARVIRNSVAHGGCINFRSSSSKAVI